MPQSNLHNIGLTDNPESPVLRQGKNACGTTALAAVLRYLQPERGITPAEIDREIRRANIFTAPTLIIRYARLKGLESCGYNHGSLDGAEKLLTRGIPVIALINTAPGTFLAIFSLHWVVLLGISRNQAGRRVVHFYNPWGAHESFEEKECLRYWGEICLFGWQLWDRYSIAVAPPGTALPEEAPGGAIAANTVAEGIANIVNGWSRLLRDWQLGRGGREILKGSAQSVDGMVRKFLDPSL